MYIHIYVQIEVDGDEVAESINDDSVAKDPSGDDQDVIKLKEVCI
jgi:hypothetical protein